MRPVTPVEDSLDGSITAYSVDDKATLKTHMMGRKAATEQLQRKQGPRQPVDDSCRADFDFKGVIFFSSCKGEYGFLSNFYKADLRLDGETFTCSEQ